MAFWKKERAFYFVEHFLVLFLPRIVLPGWFHAGQLHGGHRDHGEGVRSCLHSREKHHREIPPTTLWAGCSSFSSFLFPSHNNFRFGPRMTMRFSREWWSRRTLICKWKHWSCYNKGTNPWQIPNEKVKIQNPCQIPNEKVKIQIPGMECFLSLSNLPRSLLQWRGRIKLCRRWQGSTKNEIILCTVKYFESTYKVIQKVTRLVTYCHIFWKFIHR